VDVYSPRSKITITACERREPQKRINKGRVRGSIRVLEDIPWNTILKKQKFNVTNGAFFEDNEDVPWIMEQPQLVVNTGMEWKEVNFG